MATTQFMNVKDVSVELHEMPNLGRTALHILIDTIPHAGVTMHEEVVIMWNGPKETLLEKLGMDASRVSRDG
jgi:hypothetical protein